MTFNIEIIRADGATSEILCRASVNEISPQRAKIRAVTLLELYARRGATEARVLNASDEELYRVASN